MPKANARSGRRARAGERRGGRAGRRLEDLGEHLAEDAGVANPDGEDARERPHPEGADEHQRPDELGHRAHQVQEDARREPGGAARPRRCARRPPRGRAVRWRRTRAGPRARARATSPGTRWRPSRRADGRGRTGTRASGRAARIRARSRPSRGGRRARGARRGRRRRCGTRVTTAAASASPGQERSAGSGGRRALTRPPRAGDRGARTTSTKRRAAGDGVASRRHATKSRRGMRTPSTPERAQVPVRELVPDGEPGGERDADAGEDRRLEADERPHLERDRRGIERRAEVREVLLDHRARARAGLALDARQPDGERGWDRLRGEPLERGRGDEHDLVLDEVLEAELRVRRARAHEADLDTAGEEIGGDLRRVLHCEAHPHARILPNERAHGGGQHELARRVRGAEREDAGGRDGGRGTGRGAGRGPRSRPCATRRGARGGRASAPRRARRTRARRRAARRPGSPRAAAARAGGSSRRASAPRTRAPRSAAISIARAGSTDATGSSAMTISGSWYRARATATRCCSPPESRSTRSWSRSAIPTCASTAATRSASARETSAASARASDMRPSRPATTFCMTLACGTRWSCWCTVPMRARTRRRARGESAATSRPSTSTEPDEGASEVLRSRRSVDFPAPLGPTTATRSPGRIASEIGSSASMRPYRFAAPRSASAGAGAPVPASACGRRAGASRSVASSRRTRRI